MNKAMTYTIWQIVFLICGIGSFVILFFKFDWLLVLLCGVFFYFGIFQVPKDRKWWITIEKGEKYE